MFRSSDELLRSCADQRVVLVGNGTPIRPLGHVVDAYDIVVRFNNFQIKGFEELIGTRTTYRCTTGWGDVEYRGREIEFSPFTASAPNSLHRAWYDARNHRPLLMAELDVLTCFNWFRPSTGLACAGLCSLLGVPVSIVNMDGFRTAKYWEGDRSPTGHSLAEAKAFRRLRGVRIEDR